MSFDGNKQLANLKASFPYFSPNAVSSLISSTRSLAPKKLSKKEISLMRQKFSLYFGYNSPEEMPYPAQKAFARNEFYSHDFGTGKTNPQELTYGYLHTNPDGSRGGFVGIYSNVSPECHFSDDTLVLGASSISGSHTKIISSIIADSKIFDAGVRESHIKHATVENTSGNQNDSPLVAKSGVLLSLISGGACVYSSSVLPYIEDGIPGIFAADMFKSEISERSVVSYSEIIGGIITNSTVVTSKILGQSFVHLSQVVNSALTHVLSERSVLDGIVSHNHPYFDESAHSEKAEMVREQKHLFEWAKDLLSNFQDD